MWPSWSRCSWRSGPGGGAIERLDDLGRQAATKLQREVETAGAGLAGAENKLIRLMNQAQREDTGALAEVGTELSDIPHYLQRLEVLTKETLPEKLGCRPISTTRYRSLRSALPSSMRSWCRSISSRGVICIWSRAR